MTIIHPCRIVEFKKSTFIISCFINARSLATSANRVRERETQQNEVNQHSISATIDLTINYNSCLVRLAFRCRLVFSWSAVWWAPTTRKCCLVPVSLVPNNYLRWKTALFFLSSSTIVVGVISNNFGKY